MTPTGTEMQSHWFSMSWCPPSGPPNDQHLSIELEENFLRLMRMQICALTDRDLDEVTRSDVNPLWLVEPLCSPRPPARTPAFGTFFFHLSAPVGRRFCQSAFKFDPSSASNFDPFVRS